MKFIWLIFLIQFFTSSLYARELSCSDFLLPRNNKIVDLSREELVEIYEAISPAAKEKLSDNIFKYRPDLENFWQSYQSQQSLLSVDNFRAAHVIQSGAYVSLLAGSLFIGNTITDELREAGINNLITLHYTNFLPGIGFIGMMDNILSTYSPKTRSINLLVTAVIFTYFNANFELFSDRVDWADFISGQSGLSLYVFLHSYIEYKFKTKLLRKKPSDENLKDKVRRIFYPRTE